MEFKKQFRQLSEHEVIKVHLNYGKSFTEDMVVLSTLNLMEMETRHAIVFDRSNVLLPLLGSFAILDQVGTCYSNSGLTRVTNRDWSGVKKALYYFMDYPESSAEIKALWALRNGVVHNASMTSHTKNQKQHSWFRFDFEMATTVKPPKEPWNGRLKDRSEDNLSSVNPRQLVDSISDMLNKIRRLNEDGSVHLELPGGKDELVMSFLHTMPKSSPEQSVAPMPV